MVSMFNRAFRSTRIHSRFLQFRVIIFYDTLLTFSREVECIWKRKWSATAALFLLNRYGAVLRSILQLLNEAALPLVRSVIYELSQKHLFMQRSAKIHYIYNY